VWLRARRTARNLVQQRRRAPHLLVDGEVRARVLAHGTAIPIQRLPILQQRRRELGEAHFVAGRCEATGAARDDDLGDTADVGRHHRYA
jgi:hypothetical protein